MVVPGTLLGFSNLMTISAHHGSASLPAAWMEGHGHAQMFGWIGSFILGIGFYSQPARDRSAHRIPLTCFSLWTVGVALRWLANIYAWHWRTLFPVSAGFELIAVLLFLSAASHHKLPESAHNHARDAVWADAAVAESALTRSVGLLRDAAKHGSEGGSRDGPADDDRGPERGGRILASQTGKISWR
jgi:hypothetical protein